MYMRYLVNDVEASIEFYIRFLNFELLEQYGPAMAILKRGEFELWLAGPPSSAAKAMPDGTKPEPGGWNRMVLSIENLTDLVSKLHSHGVRFRNEIITGPGGSQILCEDPSGNPIELFQPKNEL